MSDNLHFDNSNSKRAFHQGVLLAFWIALAPLAFISLGLFLSGRQPQDFNPDLRYALLGVWLIYVFTADKIASFRLWLRIPLLRADNRSEMISIVVFSALVATMRLDPGAARTDMVQDWFKGFGLFLLFFGCAYALYRAAIRSRRRTKARRQANDPDTGLSSQLRPARRQDRTSA